MSVVWTTKSQSRCYGSSSCKLVQLVSPLTESVLISVFMLQCLIHFDCFTVNVHMPKDRVTQMHQGYGFVEFLSEDDADYGIKIMNMIKLYGKPIRVNKASAHQKNLDVGANIFIGNLDPEVDEKLLYDTFSAFGVILQTPKVNDSQTHSVVTILNNVRICYRLCEIQRLEIPKDLLSSISLASKHLMQQWTR